MRDDVQTNENSPESRKYPRTLVVFFLIGCISLLFAGTGMLFNDGTQHRVWLPLVQPLFIGIPATLLSIVLSFVYRMKDALRRSLMLLLAHILMFAVNLWIGVVMCC